MKFYLASRFAKKDWVRDMRALLEAEGHEIIGDWTDQPNVKPYEEHAEEVAEFMQLAATSVQHCDIFVLLSDEAGTAMYTELGIALATHELRGVPQVFVIGEHLSRNPFFFHPAVMCVKTIHDVLEQVAKL